MIILTERAVDYWDVPVGAWTRACGELCQDKGNEATHLAIITMLPMVLGAVLVISGLAKLNWQLATAGFFVLVVAAVGIRVVKREAQKFLGARTLAIDTYLSGVLATQVVAQATQLGPGYLGRKFLLSHLAEREPGWSLPHLATLAALARSEELPTNQMKVVIEYLNRHHPGWTGVGIAMETQDA